MVERGPELIPVDVRLTATPGRRDAADVERFKDLLGGRAAKGLVVCLCRERFPLTARVDAVPFETF